MIKKFEAQLAMRWFAVIALVFSLTIMPMSASLAKTEQADTVSADAGTIRLAGLSEFIDGVMAQQLATREVAGAIVSVVYKGKLVFSHGYGMQDVDRGIPVDGNKTLFRPGSVSKLVTWVALMQQVERGRVDLNADVNTYLDFEIPNIASRKPILVRNLMTHSAGFDDRFKSLYVRSPAEFVELRDYLSSGGPERVHEPGVEISYSNYSSVLAGYIVQRVSGEEFSDYVDKHIFGPLGMMSSTFREPLTGKNAENMALGYRFEDGRFVARPYEFIHNVAPAGSVSATGPDMAKFMIALLNDGRYGSTRILKPETLRLMRETELKNAPSLPGLGLGFIVLREAGPRLIGHGGNTQNFHSSLVLAPESDFGLFISETGGKGSHSGRTELQNAIIGRVFPQDTAPRWTQASSPPPAGAYRINRRDYSAIAQPQNDIIVSARGEHGLLTVVSGVTTYWEQIGPNLYEQVTGARAGGPFDRLEFYGSAADQKMSFGSQPYVLYRLVKP